MIDRLQRIASTLDTMKWLLLVLALVFASVFVWALLEPMGSEGESPMLPAIAGFCWMVLLYSFAALFARIPEPPQRSHGWRRRMSLKLRRGLMTVMAVLMLALGLAVLVLSWQLMRTWFMN